MSYRPSLRVCCPNRAGPWYFSHMVAKSPLSDLHKVFFRRFASFSFPHSIFFLFCDERATRSFALLYGFDGNPLRTPPNFLFLFDLLLF